MVHRCVINSVVTWLHILVGPCWCVYVALFGTAAQLVRHCAISPKFGGSIPDGATGIFY